MVEVAVEFWWNMLLTIFPAKEARKLSSELRRKFATSFAETFENFTLEVAGAYFSLEKQEEKIRTKIPQLNSNWNSGASRPSSTLQGSAFEGLCCKHRGPSLKRTRT